MTATIPNLTVVKKPGEAYLTVRESDGDRELTLAECEALHGLASLTGAQLLGAVLAMIDFDGMDENTFTIAELRRALS